MTLTDIDCTDHRIASEHAGCTLLLRNKTGGASQIGKPRSTILFVHGATYPSTVTFDYAVDGEWDQETRPEQGLAVFAQLEQAAEKRFVLLGRATHSAMLEPGRHALRQVAQDFLDVGRSM